MRTIRIPMLTLAFAMGLAATQVVNGQSDGADESRQKLDQAADRIADQLGEKFEKMAEEHARQMEAWAEEYGKKWEAWGRQFESRIENWAQNHEKDMERWAEEYGKQWEALAERIGREAMSSEEIEKIVRENLKVLNDLPIKELLGEAIPRDLVELDVEQLRDLDALRHLRELHEENAAKQLEMAERLMAEGKFQSADEGMEVLKKSLQELQEGLDAKRANAQQLIELKKKEIEKQIQQHANSPENRQQAFSELAKARNKMEAARAEALKKSLEKQDADESTVKKWLNQDKIQIEKQQSEIEALRKEVQDLRRELERIRKDENP